MVDINPILEPKDINQGKVAIFFTLGVSHHFSALYRFSIDSEAKTTCMSIELLESGRFCSIRSSEIIKNICRTVRSINSMAFKSQSYFSINPKSGQITIKKQGNIAYS
jgi:hypothetical protein